MPYCKKCGFELDADAAFCSKCGTPNVLSSGAVSPSDSSSVQHGTKVSGGGRYTGDLEDIPAGTVLDNCYEIKKKLGAGGYAVVYKAYDKDLDEVRALKVFPNLADNDLYEIEKLRAECKLIDKIKATSVVQFYGISIKSNPKYIVLEYVPGGTLEEKLAKALGFRFSEKEAVEIATKIASAMRDVHSEGIIHKDLKPSNIMITDKGDIKVMDFGISIALRSTKSRTEATSRAGTYQYMSPEHIKGTEVGYEADVWSFGVMLYQMLSGRFCFAGETWDQVDTSIRRHLDVDRDRDTNQLVQYGRVEQVVDVSDRINDLIDHCLKYDYRERLRNFGEVIDFLESKVERVIVAERPHEVLTPAPRIITPKPVLPLAGPSPGMTFVRIPAGSFEMGSDSGFFGIGGESGRYVNEKQHRVTLSGFEMQTTEVTQGMWVAIMGSNPSDFQGDNLPVENVSWDDCQEFIVKLNHRDRGTNYRLPTDSEWEYACRAGTTTRFNLGGSDSDLDCAGWYNGNSDSKTHPVGQKQANSWGLYDMHGNVWEWCEDWYDAYPSGSVTNPHGPSSGSNRVNRGGGWRSYAQNCRSANRGSNDPSYRYYGLGFRLVRSL